jgi:hypothetical protein
VIGDDGRRRQGARLPSTRLGFSWGARLSPRFDHRPPIIAFLFLVVVAFAVIGSSARAGDGLVVAGGPIAARADASGVTETSVRPQPADRVRVASRSDDRAGTVEPLVERATIHPERSALFSARTSLSRLIATVDQHGNGTKRGWVRHTARKPTRLALHAGRHLGPGR